MFFNNSPDIADSPSVSVSDCDVAAASDSAEAEVTASYELSSYSDALSEAALPQPEHSISTVPMAHTVSNFNFTF